MRESRDSKTLKIREPYDPMFRAMFLVSAAIIAALGIGFGVADLFDSSRSGIERIGAALGGTLGVVVAYGLWRADLAWIHRCCGGVWVGGSIGKAS